MRKYVFFDLFAMSGLPKYMDGLVAYMKVMVGSEILTVQFDALVRTIQETVEQINQARGAQMIVRTNTHVDEWLGRKTVKVFIYKRPNDESPVIRLYGVEVYCMWAEYAGELKPFTFKQWNMLKERVRRRDASAIDEAEDLMVKMSKELQSGVSVEEVADRYVRCQTPELRQQLIDGMKSVLGKGGEV